MNFIYLVLALGALLGMGACWIYGYNRGVTDTEERWNDAVQRKHIEP